MELVEVDVIGAQPAQAGLDGAAHVQRGQATGVGQIPGGDVQLGGQHDLVATDRVSGEPAADDLLAGAGA